MITIKSRRFFYVFGGHKLCRKLRLFSRIVPTMVRFCIRSFLPNSKFVKKLSQVIFFPLFLKGSKSFCASFESRFVSLGSPISLPLYISIFSTYCDVESHIAQILMPYFSGLDGMYSCNGQQPRNVTSFSSTVRLGPGTDASKRGSFQIHF